MTKPTNEILDRMPPADKKAEMAVIGSVLLVSSVLDDISALLSPEDFYDDANGEIYRQLTAIHESGKKADMMLLVDRLKKTKDGQQSQYDFIGGAVYLAEITRSVATAANAKHYAAIVRDAATQRAMIEVATDMLRDSYEPRLDVDEHLTASEQKLFNVRDRRTATSEKIVGAADLLQAALSEMQSRERGDSDDGLPTGFVDLDKIVRLRPGHLIIIAGRPSMGKSALAVNIALHVAGELKVSTLFTTLEMSEIEIADRMLAATARIDGSQIRDPGSMPPSGKTRIIEAVAELSQLPFTIDYSPSRSLSDIAAVCRRQKRKNKLGILIVDYLQLVSPADTKIIREQQVAQLSKGFKALARELNIPIILLAQLNRQSVNSESKRPLLSHLRESGAIEQDADAVLFVHRQEYYHTPQDAQKLNIVGMAEIIIAKQRGGSTGIVTLTWSAPWTRFDNYKKPAEDCDGYEPAFEEYQPQF